MTGNMISISLGSEGTFYPTRGDNVQVGFVITVQQVDHLALLAIWVPTFLNIYDIGVAPMSWYMQVHPKRRGFRNGIMNSVGGNGGDGQH